MSTLKEVEAAAEALPQKQQKELFRFLAARLTSSDPPPQGARLILQGDDALLEAPPGAPPMTPENVKRILENWP